MSGASHFAERQPLTALVTITIILLFTRERKKGVWIFFFCGLGMIFVSWFYHTNPLAQMAESKHSQMAIPPYVVDPLISAGTSLRINYGGAGLYKIESHQKPD